MDATRYADHKPQSIPRCTSSARPATPDRTPRRRKSLANLAADKPAVAKATSRVAHSGGRTQKKVAFNASV